LTGKTIFHQTVASLWRAARRSWWCRDRYLEFSARRAP